MAVRIKDFLGKSLVLFSVRNSLQSSGGPIGPLGSEVQWPIKT